MGEPYFDTVFISDYDYQLVLKGRKDNSSNRNNALTVILLLNALLFGCTPNEVQKQMA